MGIIVSANTVGKKYSISLFYRTPADNQSVALIIYKIRHGYIYILSIYFVFIYFIYIIRHGYIFIFNFIYMINYKIKKCFIYIKHMVLFPTKKKLEWFYHNTLNYF